MLVRVRLAGMVGMVALLVAVGEAGSSVKAPRLDGSFAIKVTVAGGSNLLDRKVGDVLDRKWSFAPRCARGACDVVLSRQSPSSGIIVVPLRFNGRAYVGTETFVGPYLCAGQTVQGGESGPITWTVRVTRSRVIDGQLRASVIAGSDTQRFQPVTALVAKGCTTPVTEIDRLTGTRVNASLPSASAPPAGA
jgi:hypothetical protein